MKRRLNHLAAGAFAIVLSSWIAGAAAPRILNDPMEGQKIAAELRSAKPAENGSITGVLRIHSPGQPTRTVPIKSTVTVNASDWLTTYEARPTDGPAEKLIIRHTTGKPNQYEWTRGDAMVTPSPATATNSFAGSHFALLDLGLEFFHWPTQLLVLKEMRKGRGCDVLESRPASVSYYSSVSSWIDQDTRAEGTPGLLMAKANDSRGKPLKEFEVSKVGGGELRELVIRNVQSKGRTEMIFDSPEK